MLLCGSSYFEIDNIKIVVATKNKALGYKSALKEVSDDTFNLFIFLILT